MKLLIADDMEGISGVVDWTHVNSTHPEYQRFRRVMTAEVNAAIEGALQAGAAEVVVSDGHGGAKNILVEELHPRARINSGGPSPYSMVNGVDLGVDAAVFIGYHARAGTLNAILAHTWSSSTIYNVYINDHPIGEIGLNAALVGHFGVPVLFLSGDAAACAEASEWIPGIKTFAVKKASGFQAADCLPPSFTHPQIKTAVQKAVESYIKGSAPAPLSIKGPLTITIDLMTPPMADIACLIPGIRRLDGRRISFEAPDLPAAQHTFRSATTLASSLLS